jgi:MFS-type transporter involved in bile tolerance (Atg22 family)
VDKKVFYPFYLHYYYASVEMLKNDMTILFAGGFIGVLITVVSAISRTLLSRMAPASSQGM